MKNTYRDIYLASGNITHVHDHKWTLFCAHNGKELCYDQIMLRSKYFYCLIPKFVGKHEEYPCKKCAYLL